MKFIKNSFLTAIALFVVMAFSTDAMAQDRAAAVKTFNKARELATNGQYAQSIEKFKEAISVAEQLGEKGNDIVSRSTDKLPDLYYSKGLSEYKASQQAGTISSLETAIGTFKQAVEVGNQYGDQEIVDKANNVITQLLYKKSVMQYSQQDYEGALATINSVIERNANYATGYYQKAIILKKLDGGSLDRALPMFEKAIAVAEKTGDSQIAGKAKQSAAAQLVYLGASLLKEGNSSGAINALNKALKYNPSSSNAYYRLASAYNSGGDWDQALSAAQKALENSNGGKTAQAKIYFELAKAYKGKGQYNQACDAYANAAYGSFRNSAQHQMEYVLKCEASAN